MLPLAERLAESGHNVTMFTVSHESLNLKSKTVKFVEPVIPIASSIISNKMVGQMFWDKELSPMLSAHPYMAGVEILRKSLNHEKLDELFSTYYDLAIVDESYTSFQGSLALKLKEKYNTKIIMFATTDILLPVSNLRGLARNPVALPSTFYKSSDVYEEKDSFLNRVETVGNYLFDLYCSGPKASYYNEQAGKLIGVKEASKYKLFEESLLTVSDYPIKVGVPSSIGHDYFSVGEHCSKSGKLPAEFSAFVEGGESKGTIYVAFGSYASLDYGPPGTVESFRDALNHFTDYRVIWSYKGKVNGTKPHIKVTKWAPQIDILSHPKTILFFTHGGLKSLKEGLCAGNPMLFLPFYGDQGRNARIAIKLGFAEAISKINITSDGIREQMSKMLGNDRYLRNVQPISRQFRDGIINSLDLGVFHVDRVLKTRESSIRKFQRRSIRLGWTQFLCLDIISIPLFLLFIIKS